MENLTQANFSEKTSKGKCVIDYWAPWCGPCKMQGPIFEETSKEVPDVHFYKVNVDEEPGLAQTAGVRGIPTMLFCNDGIVKHQHAGLLNKELLKQKINEHLG